MTLTLYEPWSIVNRLHRDLDRLMSRELGLRDDASLGAVSEWVPAVDIQERDDAFVITADVPGVKPEDIEITMENGVLSLRGRREHEASTKENGYRRIERARGEFFRRFSLPDTADADSIEATCSNGVLTVRIAKKPEVQPRRIQVRAN
ncbi:MAG: Hsp20/alpha crystallin family protein [Gammaproteobacteria bacterium]|mgnify:CR=1 FL=1|nr:heat-shock protein Hsp20 [Gammaproteobacteria bacterium]